MEDMEEEEKPFMCGICEDVFISMRSLEKHVNVHLGKTLPRGERKKRAKKGSRPKVTKMFECHECGKEYKTNVKLLLHLTSHTGLKPYGCDMCDARFSVLIEMNKHKMSHTGEKPYKCNYCPAAFLLRSDLERHDMAHTGNKPFKCTLCDYQCVRKPLLEYHMNTHTGETPYKCDFYGCGAEYANPATLKKHKLKHGPPVLKTCKVCKEKFPDMTTLKRHMEIHPGNRPVPCNQCDKIFYTESTLKRHLHVHMYKPENKNAVIKRTRNGGVKKAASTKPVVIPQKRPTSEYQVLPQNLSQNLSAAVENGVHGSLAASWTINAEQANRINAEANRINAEANRINAEQVNRQQQHSIHHSFPPTQFTNLNAWPTSMDPNELRHRLLNSFK